MSRDFDKDFAITPNGILSQHKLTMKSIEKFTGEGYSIAANGTTYRKDAMGFLPTLMEKMYEERSVYKRKMIDWQKRQQVGEKNLEKRKVEKRKA